MVDKVPGLLNDRRTMLGELNWIFTAITDTIAWNTLPRDLFQKLFRQDLLVASLFRNFLLAERIMRQAWDLALDLCLRQLPRLLEDDSAVFQHSPFFTEQLTAFDVWLKYGDESRAPPEQLPIVLQALSVGIFPYVLKLLQSNARELRPLLVFIWAKILSVDSSCQGDLVKDNGHKYFLNVLGDPYMPSKQKTMAVFVLAMMVSGYKQGQEAALQGNVISICLEQLADSSALLRQWLALCLAKVWTNFDSARWCGVRDSAHEKMYKLLNDPEPEELVVAYSGLILHFETQFVVAASQQMEEEKQRERTVAVVTGEASGHRHENVTIIVTPPGQEAHYRPSGFNRLDNEIFVNRNVGIPSVITFHPYQSELAVADKDGISFWDWEQGPKVGYLVNGNPRHTKISTLEYLNAHDNTLLLCGSDDGCVRLWRNYVGEDVSPDLVSAFQAVSEMLPLTRGLVTNWEQHTGSLLASGDVRFIRVWDTHKELKVQDIPTGADSCVTCLASDMSGRSLLIAGCGDGSVRLRVMTLREHGRWIVKVHLQKGPEGKIVTASGSLNQYIGVYNQSGDSLSTIKYHDGFIGQRIGTITSLAFHPYKVKLAAGSTDSDDPSREVT
ncbi:RPTOR-like protein [Mya arenaria]|uniref:RPTOR-like protein n=1 Tax=Mya arenaria TaxID=6604 RepID=A0ABY7DGI4_MYAAR|nr:RPTOR-like protein [Mya arenaria]